MSTRFLKIEATGDFAAGRVRPRLRLMGLWFADAGFTPGTRVQVQRVASGILELRVLHRPPVDDEPALLADAGVPHEDQRPVLIRRAWRGSSSAVFSPALWMDDAELEDVARRVKGRTSGDIRRAVRVAEAAPELIGTCQDIYESSQRVVGTGREAGFTFDVQARLARMLHRLTGGRP